MAKKKKKSSKKRAPVAAERSPFWSYAGAILLFLLALFLLLGAIRTGGKLPVGLFDAAYAVMGLAAFFTPVAFVYWGVYKFMSEDRRIPLGKLFSMLGVLVFAACWGFTAFASEQTTALGTDYSGGFGGWVGETLGGAVLTLLDKLPAAILFFVFTVLMVFLTFSISPRVLLHLGAPFRRKASEDDTDIEDLKARAEKPTFKLNEGVPVEHGEAEDAKPRHSTFKNSAQPLSKTENHEALTVPSDPDWVFPSVDLLSSKQNKANPGDVNKRAEIIQTSFANFNIDVAMEGANVGPRITQYTMKPPAGVRLSKITALDDNLSLDLKADVRIEAPIPGTDLVGIEVPNIKSATVLMSSLLQSKDYQELSSPLSFVIGKDIAGKPVVADLAKMPHLLVAGQTGSGKSVMINAILTSLLYRNTPSDLKLILVDPKQVEMIPYNDIPHLLTPVITEPEKTISALKWAVAEMERRLKTMAAVHRRNIAEYNNLKKEEGGMPYVVIVIDEMNDLMMAAGREVEALIVRIAQKARAAGIHLVLATQRPSVNVITGLIKANVPGRIAFKTAQRVDSQIILDQPGADKLLGQGDLLIRTDEIPKPKRVQGAFISDEETVKVTEFLREQRAPNYDDEVVSQQVVLNGKGGVVADYGNGGAMENDDMWQSAVRVVVEGGKASTSLLQRRLGIGYGRAAKYIDMMEEQGIVGASTGNRPREVLVSSVDQVFGGAPDPEENLEDV